MIQFLFDSVIVLSNHKTMKQVLTLFTFLTFSIFASAQISEASTPLSLGSQNAFVIEHEGADKKMVNKILEDAINDYGKVKRNKKANEWNCLQCEVPGISGPTNIYFKIEEGKGMTRSYVFFDDGTKFISSDNEPELAQRLREGLNHVQNNVTRKVISNHLNDQENVLKDRNKELGKLEKKNKDLHEDIEKYKQKIAEAEKGIEKNLQEQEDKKIEIEKQKRVVEDVTTELNNVGNN